MDRLALPLFALLVIASAIFRCSLALGPIDNIDGWIIPDDAYLFLDIARSIGQGDGPLYGREFTNGFQPLFGFLLAPVFWWFDGGDAPLRCSLLLGTLFDTAALVLLGAFMRRICDGSWWPAVTIAGAWVFNHAVLRNALNGMETSLAMFCIILAVVAHRPACAAPRWSPSRLQAMLTGATLGLAMLARVDSVLIAVALSVWIALRLARFTLVLDRPVSTILFWATGAAIAFSPWVLYSYAYTGDLYPVSGHAVRFQANAHYELFPLPDGVTPLWVHCRRAGGEILRGNGITILATFGLFAVAALRRPPKSVLIQGARLLLPLALHSTLLVCAYVGYVHGTWFFHRYLFPVALPCFAALGLATHAATRGLKPGLRLSIAVVIAAFAAFASTRTQKFGEITTHRENGHFGYRAIGLWVRNRFEPGTVIGAKQSGAISYYADRCEVLNLDGVVNRSAFRALEQRRMFDWLSSQGIASYVLWDYGAEFLRHFSKASKAEEKLDLVKVETAPDIHSWGDHGTNLWSVFRLE